MKSIKKIKESSKAVAGTALLVGATLAGGAAMASNHGGSSGSSDLGDYPHPFVDDEGSISSTIVMGEDAKATDVVAATNLAGQLGNDAFMSESVSTGSGSAGTWAAENGVTLNRQNSDLFLNDASNAEETRLDNSDLAVLETTTFDSEENEEVEVEHEVQIGTQNQNFNVAGDRDDPVLHLTNPTSPNDGEGSNNGNLLAASVEFSETMNFAAAGEGNLDSLNHGDEAIEDGDEIEMFGQEFTFSDDSSDSELVLYGSSERVEVATGESATVTIDGDEVTLESTYVADSDPRSATVIVSGQTESVEEGDTVGPAGNIRVSDIYRTGPDGEGRVAFSQGSDELVIQSDGDVEVDGETLDGVEVNVDDNSNGFGDVDGIDFYFGAADSDENYVAAGESYETPLFGLEFHYGGLTGDTAENPAEAIDVEANEDGAATITVSDSSGDSADITFADNDQAGDLAADSGEFISTFEGERLEEDDRVVLNSNEEAGMYEITAVTEDLANADDGNGDVEVTLRNVVTGDTTTVEEDDIDTEDDEYTDSDGNSVTGDGSSGDIYTLDSESIEGKDFDVSFYRGADEVSFERTGEDSVQVFPNVYTESDAAVAFTEDVTWDAADFEAAFSNTESIQLPSTASSSDNVVNLADEASSTTFDTSGDGLVVDGDEVIEIESAGEVDYVLNVSNTASEVTLGVSDDQTDSDVSTTLDPSAVVIQPEDDEDEEHGYIFTPDVTEDDGDLTTSYTGPTPSSGADGDIDENAWITDDLDSEDGVEVGYNDYGAYTMYDSDNSDRDEFALHLPAAQSTAGLAVTGTDGSLSADGSSSGGSVTTQTPTGWSTQSVALDSDSSVESAKQDSHMILVGGPAANSLVGELAEANKTMPAADYTEGQGMIDLVPDAFSEGNHALVVAGYSGEDTRQAGAYLANYAQHSEELSGQDSVSINTAEGTLVQ